uniref:RING-type domain-containing protein n=1 Tax=Tetranychus urticae TaxID=32264 RepID=A0A158P5M1_TETUR
MLTPSIENWSCPEALQTLKKFMRMKFLENRFDSFSGFDLKRSKVYSAVYDGFYLSDDKAFFVCFCCGLHIPTSLADLNIVDLHCTFSLNCAYLKHEELGLKVWYDVASRFAYYCVPRRIECNYQQTLIKIFRLEKQSTNTIVKSVTSKQMVNPNKVYQLFQMRENRTFSFQHSKYTTLEANTLVESGFFYCGFGYIVQCAFCALSFDGKLRSNPSLIHKHLYPGCPFLTASKYENDRNNCVVCLVEPRKVLYSPCNHLVTCVACNERLKQKNMLLCPVCRSAIGMRINCISP